LYGIALYNSPNSSIYHNNFVNNAEQVYVDGFFSSVWDDGYPSGGNYWSNYAGIDKKNGPNQDYPGCDGIGDTPYTIDENNIDHYPLMNPYNGPSPPQFTLTIAATTGGTTDPDPGTYTLPFGAEVPVTAIPATNYVFDHWELDDINVGSSNPITVTIDKNHDVRAVFSIVLPPTYDVTIKAHCNSEGADVTVGFWIDDSPTIYYTPYPFTGLTGTHKFTVSTYDTSGHSFKQWSTGSTSHSISVSTSGIYTAYYEAPPPTQYDVTINGYCDTEGVNVHVNILMDGGPTGFTTPHTFPGLTGTHTFTVPNNDAKGHRFRKWNTDDTSTTITVTSGTTLTAYYEDQGNLIAANIEAIQTIFASDLVQGKPTTFFITYKSTFIEDKKAQVCIDLEGFDYNSWIFEVTLKPGVHDLWLHSEDLKAPVIIPTSTSSAGCKVTLDAFNEIAETKENDNTFPSSGMEQYIVWDTKGLKVLFVRLYHVDEPTEKRITNTQAYSYMIKARDFLRAVYPVAPYEVIFELSPSRLKVSGTDTYKTICNKLLDYKTGYDRVVGVASGWGYIGMGGWDAPSLFGVGGLGCMDWPNKRAVLVRNILDASVAHEIGHTYFLGDDYLASWFPSDALGSFICRHWSGYWVSSREELTNVATFMHAGDYAQYWVDNTDYGILLEKFKASDPEVVLVSGTISKNGTAKFSDMLCRIPEGQADLEGSSGDYYITLLDVNRNVLCRNGFNITFLCMSDPPVKVNEVSFCFTVRWIEGTRIIQLEDTQENVLDTRDVSQNPPSINVLSPNGNETFNPGKSYTITWSASDPDSDPLTYAVLISDGVGSTPIPIATNLNQTSFTFDFTNLPSWNQYQIYVIANDGVNVAYDASDGFFSVSGFTIDAITKPKTLPSGGKANYVIEITSYGGFSGPVTLNAGSTTENLTFRWVVGPTIVVPQDGHIDAIIEVEAGNTNGGNQTILVTGVSGNCTGMTTTYVYVTTNDISVSNVLSTKNIVGEGYSVTIKVTIHNQGNFLENSTLSLYCNSTLITSQFVYLHAGTFSTINFVWNTSGFAIGRYTISAYVEPVPGEKDIVDNRYVDGIVDIVPFYIDGPYYTWYGAEYWIVELIEGKAARIVSNYY
jgi:hypothetical protein